LTVYGHFEVGLGEGERNLERLIDEEWESTGTGVDFGVAPAGTLREFRAKI
jgi:hypothetical protein